MKSQLQNLLVLVISVCVSLVAAEVLWRLLRSARYGPATNPSYVLYDPDLGWRYKPNSRVRHRTPLFDVEVSIDSQGWRACPNGVEWQHRTDGIVFLGDSRTFGWGVDAGESFPCLVRAQLRTAVLNLGVAGYGTDQEYMILLREALAHQPTLVVLTYSGNDPGEVISARRYGRAKPRLEVRDGEVTISPARQHATLLDRYSSLYLSGRYFLERWRKPRSVNAADRRRGRELVAQLIDAMARNSAARGIPLVLVADSIPWLADRFGESDAVTYVDVGPALRQRRQAGGPVVLGDGDAHWNPRGHRVVARELAREIQRLRSAGMSR